MQHHDLSPHIILGYHGCDEEVGERLLKGEPFKPSENDYDWLGHGIYFWEANPQRALSFAREQKSRGRIRKPFVIGAALTLGHCIDLMNEGSIESVAAAHEKLVDMHKKGTGHAPLTNTPLLKRLDCAVIMMLHDMLAETQVQPADSLRGLYHEGGALYPGSAFSKKAHVQICIRSRSCIKGVFRVSR